MTNLFTVWIGGIPILERVSLSKAIQERNYWIDQGYDDVAIEGEL